MENKTPVCRVCKAPATFYIDIPAREGGLMNMGTLKMAPYTFPARRVYYCDKPHYGAAKRDARVYEGKEVRL
jgi:hypothetical protein